VSLALLGPQVISFLSGEKPMKFISQPGDRPTLFQATLPIIEQVKPAASTVKKTNRDLAPVVTTDVVPDTEVTQPTDILLSGTEKTGGETIPLQGWPDTGVETTAASPLLTIVDFAEVMPSYEGGLKAMMKFIQKDMKYPNHAKQIGTEGKVFVKFVVNYEGKVVNVEIIRGISEDCDKEAARVIAMMPNWKPGMQNKMPVSVRMILPINFKLEN
jgi:protein TonB